VARVPADDDERGEEHGRNEPINRIQAIEVEVTEKDLEETVECLRECAEAEDRACHVRKISDHIRQ
jgi:hypothetical protein